MTRKQIKQNFKKNIKVQFIVFAIALIIFGGIMAIHSYSSYNTELQENQDYQLTRTVNSADRALTSMLEESITSLSRIADSKSILTAERKRAKEGDTSDLDSLFANNVFVQSDLCETILIQEDDKILYSADGDLEYLFKDDPVSDGVRICRNLNGDLFLALDYSGSDGKTYTAVLGLRQMYSDIAGGENDDYYATIFVDSSTQIALYPEDGEINAKSIEYIHDAVLSEGIQYLKESQRQGRRRSGSFKSTINGESIRYRIVADPTDMNSNGVFAIATTVNYDMLRSLITRTNIKLIIYYAIMAVGISLLVITILISRKNTEETLQELENLKHKNEIMEELQEKAENLAHMQRLETIGTLTSSIAHEFNNLLTPIMGYSIMTLEKLPPEEEELYDNILEIYNASNKAREMISRLSKLSRKNTDHNVCELDPDSVITKVVSVVTPALPKNVDMSTDLRCRGSMIMGDEVQLSQLFINLIINAFQAMKENGGNLTIISQRIEAAPSAPAGQAVQDGQDGGAIQSDTDGRADEAMQSGTAVYEDEREAKSGSTAFDGAGNATEAEATAITNAASPGNQADIAKDGVEVWSRHSSCVYIDYRNPESIGRPEILIIIEDTGTGMSEETLKKIFDPFFTTKVSGEGTGLGLAIAQQAVEDHGGMIEVRSVPGEGTTFIIHLPESSLRKPEYD